MARERCIFHPKGPPKGALGARWGPSGVLRVPTGGRVGCSGGSLGAEWGALGACWGFGSSLGPDCAPTNRSMAARSAPPCGGRALSALNPAASRPWPARLGGVEPLSMRLNLFKPKLKRLAMSFELKSFSSTGGGQSQNAHNSLIPFRLVASEGGQCLYFSVPRGGASR